MGAVGSGAGALGSRLGAAVAFVGIVVALGLTWRLRRGQLVIDARDHPDSRHTLLDGQSGLPDSRYFTLTFEQHLAAARRRLWPVTVILVRLLDPVEDDVEARRSGRGRRGHDGDAMSDDAGDRTGDMAGIGAMAAAAGTGAAGAAVVAQALRSTIRAADTACRVGGDQFALLLDDTPSAGGAWTAERIQVALAKRGLPAGLLAAGVASYPANGLTCAEVTAAAEQALAEAVAAGPGSLLGPVRVAPS